MADKTFREIERRSDEYGETNDCGVKAVALATGVHYGTVWELFSKHGRKNSKGVCNNMMRAVVKELGFSINYLVHQYWCDDDYRFKRSTDRFGKTPKSIRNLDPSRKYLIHVYRHVLAYVNGSVEDWTKNRRHIIKEIW